MFSDPFPPEDSASLAIAAGGAGCSDPLEILQGTIAQRRLTALFQPIVDLGNSRVIGFEGLIRGPSDHALHAPPKLLRLARREGLAYELETLCAHVLIDRFVELGLHGRLFINLSPDVLVSHRSRGGASFAAAHSRGLDAERIVIELTEDEPVRDANLEALLSTAAHYRAQGMGVAIDDLGQGYSSLRLWSELRPDFVKIDRYFIQNVDRDPVKARFIRSLQDIARKSGCSVIAEGIETHAELALVRDLGVGLGQGYHLARPASVPATLDSTDAVRALKRRDSSSSGSAKAAAGGIGHKLLIAAPAASPLMTNQQVFEMFEANPQLESLAVVDGNDIPVGLISRHSLIDRFARPYRHELYGRRPCTAFMDSNPLVVERDVSIEQLGRIVADGDPRHLANGYIITDHGEYRGIGTGHDLMREITELQLRAARYANPLTQLPGNVPINEHIETLLAAGCVFVACYCDLDNFKPFNDVYGFGAGDAMIQETGEILASVCIPERDFLGHIGGDDFIILFCSEDWEARCQAALRAFADLARTFFGAEDRQRGGFVAENRRGEQELHPLTTLSIGAVKAEPGAFHSYHEISAVAAESKKMAKQMPGNSLYVNRRRYSFGRELQ